MRFSCVTSSYGFREPHRHTPVSDIMGVSFDELDLSHDKYELEILPQ